MDDGSLGLSNIFRSDLYTSTPPIGWCRSPVDLLARGWSGGVDSCHTRLLLVVCKRTLKRGLASAGIHPRTLDSADALAIYPPAVLSVRTLTGRLEEYAGALSTVNSPPRFSGGRASVFPATMHHIPRKQSKQSMRSPEALESADRASRRQFATLHLESKATPATGMRYSRRLPLMTFLRRA
ncbi:hypothetical protein PENSPDRAFT_513145 [Peniophora sp. CONT]|nr:hypothetical protein PENSPDRAFT_513145 [Peniophora sp. CONT]